jgi:MFS transporter, SP family, general alpha glucoside:H+ symporter
MSVEEKASVDHVDAEGKAGIAEMGTEDINSREGAIEAENAEHSMTVLQAVRAYPMATFWAFVMSSTIIMESYDVFLMNNFLALKAFQKQFGVFDPNTNSFVVVTKWQSALQMSGQLGALIGVFLAGPLTSRIGYRWATLLGLMLLNATIFVSYFADSLPVFFVGQLLEGIPWGIFIANAPAYCSEIVPLRLRAPATQMLQMFWAIGSIIVGAVTFVYNNHEDKSAYRYVPCFSADLTWLMRQ